MTVPGDLSERARSVIVQADGTRFYEVGLQITRGVREAPTLHLCSDMGPVGLQAQQWLLCHMGLRATTSYDLLHRVASDVAAATTTAGLMVLRLEAAQITKLRKAVSCRIPAIAISWKGALVLNSQIGLLPGGVHVAVQPACPRHLNPCLVFVVVLRVLGVGVFLARAPLSRHCL